MPAAAHDCTLTASATAAAALLHGSAASTTDALLSIPRGCLTTNSRAPDDVAPQRQQSSRPTVFLLARVRARDGMAGHRGQRRPECRS